MGGEEHDKGFTFFGEGRWTRSRLQHPTRLWRDNLEDRLWRQSTLFPQTLSKMTLWPKLEPPKKTSRIFSGDPPFTLFFLCPNTRFKIISLCMMWETVQIPSCLTFPFPFLLSVVSLLTYGSCWNNHGWNSLVSRDGVLVCLPSFLFLSLLGSMEVASWNTAAFVVKVQSVFLIGLPPLIRRPWSSCDVYSVRIFDTGSTSRFLGFPGWTHRPKLMALLASLLRMHVQRLLKNGGKRGSTEYADKHSFDTVKLSLVRLSANRLCVKTVVTASVFVHGIEICVHHIVSLRHRCGNVSSLISVTNRNSPNQNWTCSCYFRALRGNSLGPDIRQQPMFLIPVCWWNLHPLVCHETFLPSFFLAFLSRE